MDPERAADVSVGGRALALRVRRHARARHMTLRLDPADDTILLTLPRDTPVAEGMAFIEEKAGWIMTELAARPAPVPFADRAVVPYLGVPHQIRHSPGGRSGVLRCDGHILVGGSPVHLRRRVGDWYRQEARREFAERARQKARRIDRRVRRVAVRDTSSRWGSCRADGTIGLSWRLLLAPEFVLDYVVAHEVAHLAHMNHGTRFWVLVDGLTASRAEATRWLRRHGERLHRFG